MKLTFVKLFSLLLGVTLTAAMAHAAENGHPNPGGGLHVGLRRIFDKVMRFWRRLKNLFHGDGFYSDRDLNKEKPLEQSLTSFRYPVGVSANSVRWNRSSRPGARRR